MHRFEIKTVSINGFDWVRFHSELNIHSPSAPRERASFRPALLSVIIDKLYTIRLSTPQDSAWRQSCPRQRGVAVGGQPMARRLVAERRHILYAAGIAPAVVEVEQSANRDGVVNRFVGPSGPANFVQMLSTNLIGLAIHDLDEFEERLFRFGDRCGSIVLQNRRHLPGIPEQFRRDRGVATDSKRTLIAAGGKGRNQLSLARR